MFDGSGLRIWNRASPGSTTGLVVVQAVTGSAAKASTIGLTLRLPRRGETGTIAANERCALFEWWLPD